MKRLSAILFLFILVFNFVGYRLVISVMENAGDVALEKKLDKQEYNDNELISIKTALNLPYYTPSSDFERSYGSINLHGVVYEYVKQRVYNDTLELLCLPNAVKTKLQNTNNDLAKASADGQASTPLKKAPTTLKVSLPDFCQPLQIFVFSSTAVEKKYFLQNEIFSPSRHNGRQERPPQTMDIVS